MGEVKLCKDCKHYAPNSDGGNCNAPENYPMVMDFVNGGERRAENPTRFFRAQNVREDEHLAACGPSGIWWQAK